LTGFLESAGTAATAQNDVLNITDRTAGLARHGDLHSGQTNDIPTVIAEKMRMFGPVAIFGPEALKTPDVVTQVDPGGKPVFDQIVQITVDSGPIEPERDELLCQVRMAQGRFCGLESPEDLQPRHCRPEASLAENSF
jgi:hypothetical protein